MLSSPLLLFLIHVSCMCRLGAIPFGPTSVYLSSPCYGDLAELRGYGGSSDGPSSWSGIGMFLRECLVEWPIAFVAFAYVVERLCAKGALRAHAVVLLRAGLRKYPTATTIVMFASSVLDSWITALEKSIGFHATSFTLPFLGGSLSEDEEIQWAAEFFVTQLSVDVSHESARPMPEDDIRYLQTVSRRTHPELYEAAGVLGVDFEHTRRLWLQHHTDQDEPRDEPRPSAQRRRGDNGVGRRGGGSKAAVTQNDDEYSGREPAFVIIRAHTLGRHTQAEAPATTAPAARPVAGRAPRPAPPSATRAAPSSSSAINLARAVTAPAAAVPAPSRAESDPSSPEEEEEDDGLPDLILDPIAPGSRGSSSGVNECLVCTERITGAGGVATAELRCGHVICAGCAGRVTHCPFCDARNTIVLGEDPSLAAPRVPVPRDDIVDD